MGNLEAEFFREEPNRKGLVNTEGAFIKWLEKEVFAARAEIESLKLSVGELNGAFNARPKCEKCRL